MSTSTTDSVSLELKTALQPDIIQDIETFAEGVEKLSPEEFVAQFSKAKEDAELLDVKLETIPEQGVSYLKTDHDDIFYLLPTRIVTCLGRGSTGIVYLVQNKLKPDILLAVKTFQPEGPEMKDPKRGRRLKRRFLLESTVLQRLNHSCIVKHLSSFVCPKYSIIFMEFCHYGNLSRHVDKLNLAVTTRWFLQIASAVHFLHTKNIVHRDIKMQNILVRKNLTVCLSDFDLSEMLVPGQRTVTGMTGTENYMAPEVTLAGKDGQFDGFKADAYSLGVVLFCMVTAIKPNNERLYSFSETIQTLKDHFLNYSIRHLLEVNPDDRFDVTILFYNIIRLGLASKE